MKNLVKRIIVVCIMSTIIAQPLLAQATHGPDAVQSPHMFIGTPVNVRWDGSGDCIITFGNDFKWLVEANKHQWQFRIQSAIKEGGEWMWFYVVDENNIEWLVDIKRPPWYGKAKVRPGGPGH